MRKIAFYTLGCKVNQYDTEAVLEDFKRAGYEVVPFEEYAHVYVVNTCTVTHLSDRKCRQMLRKTKRINPESILVAMGCYAQIAGETIKEQVEEIDIIVGTNRRSEIVHLVQEFESHENTPTNLVSDIMAVEEFEEMQISERGERTRVYIKIQEGCNNYCTYCIIPYVRGKIRSRKEKSVLDETKRLADLGYKEIVLTGIHVASYGKDLGNTDLVQLLQKVHEIEGIERIRMSSIEPGVVTDAFLEVLKELPKLCRHFHLSLQSGSDTVLKRMKRKYTSADYLKSVEQLRHVWPDVAITTDVIVGFPGETEEEFEETLHFVKKAELAQIHIFPYSQREGTPAAQMPNQITPEVKEERTKRLSQIEKELHQAFMKQHIGKEVEVLFENSHKEGFTGFTSNYLKVYVESESNIENTLQHVRITGIKEDELLGQLILK
ncbi:tRNA (N(6)-L-threonylcarbamoyladenosine(37)-C(2))-methylthiotransferase MtaB [Sporanaerobium hydrogeniformans]|uniref:tRNA (N(6)-L-threonylcarbamoyladenosine(37)-C(2))-methylthiotransferase MtaB n=1 Tax=Sporanaerobium hydrogeniformans TaxID=3072179 RepID=A0AC61DEC9_9FIRM|nr:tRNA (N(6)-L-threonylcarbamoyladenosine(37)-C(2))-methylthiotransferase MtaB [Sporanaerobium hydrogeniformans]PHV71521.1 tRNA (N(6)-L-threonylcarbamoyladenosine(37)-C(2))-methylthiotransferase MtaB [Sporanaerobium hydrogeniformans]